MNVWDTYSSRMRTRGGSGRESVLRREQRFLEAQLPRHLSYHHAVIDGEERELAIINSDNLDIKTLCSMPGETLPHGGLVHWMDSYWIITELDANNEVYTKAKMQQCNYYLRWIAKDGTIQERWCIIEDGTKYMIGEYTNNDFIMRRGDSRVAMTIPRDEYTLHFDRNSRFLIGDYGSDHVLSYRLTKPFKLNGVFNNAGVFKFVLAECNTESDDNFELHIADYYKYFPKEGTGESEPEQETTPDTQGGKKVWI